MTLNEFNKLVDSINECCAANIEHRDAQVCAADNMLIAAVKSINLYKSSKSKYAIIMGQEDRRGNTMHINTKYNNSHYRKILLVRTLEECDDYLECFRRAYPKRELPDILGYLDE